MLKGIYIDANPETRGSNSICYILEFLTWNSAIWYFFKFCFIDINIRSEVHTRLRITIASHLWTNEKDCQRFWHLTVISKLILLLGTLLIWLLVRGFWFGRNLEKFHLNGNPVLLFYRILWTIWGSIYSQLIRFAFVS